MELFATLNITVLYFEIFLLQTKFTLFDRFRRQFPFLPSFFIVFYFLFLNPITNYKKFANRRLLMASLAN